MKNYLQNLIKEEKTMKKSKSRWPFDILPILLLMFVTVYEHKHGGDLEDIVYSIFLLLPLGFFYIGNLIEKK